MKQSRNMYRIAILFSAALVIACAGTDVSESEKAKSRQCGFPDLSEGTQGREIVRLMEPPFMAPKEQVVLPQRHIKEYISEPYLLRYQVVEVDALLANIRTS